MIDNPKGKCSQCGREDLPLYAGDLVWAHMLDNGDACAGSYQAPARKLTLRDALHGLPVVEFPATEGDTWLQLRMGRAFRQWRAWNVEEQAWNQWQQCHWQFAEDRPVRVVAAAEADRNPGTRGKL
jgi:hypothetical protein